MTDRAGSRTRSGTRSRTWSTWLLRLIGRQTRRRAPRTAGPLRLAREAGMATAEYAIATVAAAGFAGLLVVVLRSDEVRGLLAGIVRGVLAV